MNDKDLETGTMPVADFIEAWELNYFQGNVVANLVGAEYNGNRLRDLQRAKWHLDRLIDNAIIENDWGPLL